MKLVWESLMMKIAAIWTRVHVWMWIYFMYVCICMRIGWMVMVLPVVRRCQPLSNFKCKLKYWPGWLARLGLKAAAPMVLNLHVKCQRPNNTNVLSSFSSVFSCLEYIHIYIKKKKKKEENTKKKINKLMKKNKKNYIEFIVKLVQKHWLNFIFTLNEIIKSNIFIVKKII